MNLTVQAYQRLVIAMDLVRSSVDALTELDNRPKVTQEAIGDLAVALYELHQLSQDLDTLLETTPLRYQLQYHYDEVLCGWVNHDEHQSRLETQPN